MKNQTEFTPVQLAALDLLIAQKKEGPNNVEDCWITSVVNVLGQITTTFAGGVAANNSVQSQDVVDALKNINKVSLEQLIEIRKNSGSE